jgi:hypothetical protein
LDHFLANAAASYGGRKKLMQFTKAKLVILVRRG